MKKLFLSTLLCLTLIAGTSISLASGFDSNYHVSTESPSTAITLGTSIEHDGISRNQDYPDNTWDVSTKGKYKFSGSTDHHKLYTNYLLTGKTSYKIHVENNMHNNKLKMFVYKKVWGRDKCLKKISLSTQSDKDYSVTGLDTDDEIYIYFDCPAYFEGYVK